MNKKDLEKDYRNYRWFFTSEGNLAVGGKSDEQNELVIKNFLKPNYKIIHTSAPGSPFVILQTKNPSDKEVKEGAIFCGCFSKRWKEKKKKIDIDIFNGEQIYKTKKMKTGSFAVKGEKKKMKISPELAIIIQKGKIRAVPNATKEKVLAKIKPGKLSKEEATKKIAEIIKDKFHFPVSKEEIARAVPSDKISIR